jgi:hypothetical protein
MSQKMTIDELCDMINKCHNPSLVDPNEAPNSNIIYHIYSDGEITRQKGGDVYLRRNEFPVETSLCVNFNVEVFPLKKHVNKHDTYGYAIVTQEDAKMIRNAMIQNFDR